MILNRHVFWPNDFNFPEKPVLNKKNATDFRILAFGDATTIQSTALRGHPIPYFTWFQQPVTKCVFGCKPNASQWRRVPRSAISPSAQVPSRFSSLFLPPARSGYFFRCFAENSLGHDDVVYLVHRIGEYPVSAKRGRLLGVVWPSFLWSVLVSFSWCRSLDRKQRS